MRKAFDTTSHRKGIARGEKGHCLLISMFLVTACLILVGWTGFSLLFGTFFISFPVHLEGSKSPCTWMQVFIAEFFILWKSLTAQGIYINFSSFPAEGMYFVKESLPSADKLNPECTWCHISYVRVTNMNLRITKHYYYYIIFEKLKNIYSKEMK